PVRPRRARAYHSHGRPRCAIAHAPAVTRDRRFRDRRRRCVMRRRLLPMASRLAFAILLGLFAAQVRAARPHILRPLWADPALGSETEPRTSLPPILANDLVSDPLDAAWVPMTLPSLNDFVAPRGIEFGGKLILAGAFSSAGSILANSIVSWDGSQFGSMGDPGMQAQSLVIWNGALYAGGHTIQSAA